MNYSLWLDRPLENNTDLKQIELPWTTLKDYLKHVNDGHPNEKESDFCLTVRMNTCVEDTLCDKIMTSRTTAYGYRATHKYSWMTQELIHHVK